MTAGMTSWTVAALYHFTKLHDLPDLQEKIKNFCNERSVCGTILLAPEGVNGTIAACAEPLIETIEFLDKLLGIRAGEIKYSTAEEKPFKRLKVRLKKEIVTLKTPEADPAARTGIYVAPENWSAILGDPDVTLIDTRNSFEIEYGRFPGAIDPGTTKFSEFTDFVTQKLSPAHHKKIAMYCTGGIRCEKASSYLLSQGFETVYQLKGGILKYLEQIPAPESLWNGTCFVFDEREALAHGLKVDPKARKRALASH